MHVILKNYNHGTFSPYKNWQILVFKLVFGSSCMSVSCALVIGLENFPLRNHSLIAARSYVKPSTTEFRNLIKDSDIRKKNG
jgi:hypothetical protein